MTINTKDIEALVDEHCSSIHPMELDRLLKKLDHEDLDVLRAMLEEVYDPREALADAYLKDQQDEYYDKGYKDGYETALSEYTEEEGGYNKGYKDGYEAGLGDSE